jgi:hypothetical protein
MIGAHIAGRQERRMLQAVAKVSAAGMMIAALVACAGQPQPIPPLATDLETGGRLIEAPARRAAPGMTAFAPKAIEAGVNGAAIVCCGLRDGANLTCRPVWESPVGLGVGAAVVAQAEAVEPDAGSLAQLRAGVELRWQALHVMDPSSQTLATLEAALKARDGLSCRGAGAK